MKNNTCNYSDEWQPYIGDYDKFEYDIKLNDGTIVENCYPNGGVFNSISDEHDQQDFSEIDVAEIRFSAKPRFGINKDVSNLPQYEYLNRKMKERENRFNPYLGLTEPIDFKLLGGWNTNDIGRGTRIEVRTEPKIGRNELCSCGSGKKKKKCKNH